MKKWYYLAIVLLIIASFVAGLMVGRNGEKGVEYDTKVEYVTKKAYKPVATDSSLVRYDTVWLERRGTGNISISGNIPRREESKDTVTNVEMLPQPTVIPITQKVYKDTDYTAYVSGFNAKLDSIEVRTKVITYTKTVTKFRTWNIGLTGGYGYGFRSKQFEPFIGIGITLNLFR
nr:MAG TPA: DNA-directed RNA polymerase subunit beta [Caudoviricetes sp.]